MTLLNLDTSKALRMDRIPAKCLRNGAEVLAYPFQKYIKFIDVINQINTFINKINLPR